MDIGLDKSRLDRNVFLKWSVMLVAFVFLFSGRGYPNSPYKGSGAAAGPGDYKSAEHSGNSPEAFDYILELLPGQVFEGWFYYWSLGGPISAALQENPAVGWLEVSPTSFTSASCADIIAVSYQFAAPAVPGIYTTVIQDLNGNWQDTNVLLSVTDSPTSAFFGTVQIYPGQSLALFDTLAWNGFSNVGCLPVYFPGNSSTGSYHTDPSVAWLTFQPASGTVNAGDTLIVEKTFSETSTGTFSTYEVLQAEWYSFPRFIHWTLDVTSPIGPLPTDGIAQRFELLQNYPNPFNPGTTIEFIVPSASPTTLRVYDVLGQRVKNLLDERVGAGRYTVKWDGTDDARQPVAGGVYFYRMQAGDFVAVKKMMLLK